MAPNTLSPVQVHALFDILTHQETYTEIENFKYPGAIKNYGPPFALDDGAASTSPILQSLLSSFALRLPGLRDVSPAFWQDRCQVIIEQLGAAELSESYDKSAIGSRKTLATAISALIEYPARGHLGGYSKIDDSLQNRKYDTSKPEEVMRAWDDFLQQMVYGDMIDEMFKKARETDRLEDHPSLIQGAHEYILVNLASFLYYTIVLSPDGQYLLRVMENIHKLVPYGLIRQTLKIGNAATMINGMMKLLLAKLSVTSITNWIGLSQSADEGMNLLQQIISTVLSWDINEFKKRSTKIEKSKEPPTKEQLDCIKAYIKKGRKEQERCREKSKQESKSIVAVIFESASVDASLTESQHAQALEYLSIHLSIRDREELSKILCKSNPDRLTQAIRDLVAAYDPIIRACHNAVDLSAALFDFEHFMNDFLKMSKVPPPPRKSRWPSSAPATDDERGPTEKDKLKHPMVEDYVKLLRKHQGSSHRFLHQVCKNGAEMAGWFQDYAHEAAAQFRQRPEDDVPSGSPPDTAAGSMTNSLNGLFSDLPESDQRTVLKALDAHAAYLDRLARSSAARMKSILSRSHDTDYGPGMYLARWQALLNATPITPATAQGPVRRGGTKSVRENARLDVDGKRKGGIPVRKRGTGEGAEPDAPDVSDVVKLLGPGFRKVLQQR